MTKLPAEAYAIIEGRHSDPFRYLGLHSEGDTSVVRAFLPQASNVEAIGEHGETAKLARIHDATQKTVLFVTHSIGEAVYLADEIVAIMGQPGRLAARIPINAERPRRRNDPYIADLVTRVRLELLEPPTA